MSGMWKMTERDLDTHPYSADEERVAEFLWERGLGGGDDPIGFILASYAHIVADRNNLLRKTRSRTVKRRTIELRMPRLDD